MRPLVLAVVGLTAVGLVSLLLGPVPALATGLAMAAGGAVHRRRSSSRDGRLVGLVALCTGLALAACAVLALVLIARQQDEPVRLGPDSGFDVGTSTSARPAP